METILVPADYSSAAKNAIDYAVELAKFFRAKLILVNAYPVPTRELDNVFPKDVKDELLVNNTEGLDIEYLTDMGLAYDVIESIVKKRRIDLIVMGIVGEAGAIKKHIIGSTAVKVARYIEVPTFIIPEKVSYHPIRRISFACDMQKTEETALINIVKYFSELFKAELEIVNIEGPEEEMSDEKSQTSVFIEKKLGKTKHKIVYITETHVAKGLEDYYESHQADVIIVSPKKHGVFHHLFNENITNELAFNLHTPILAIH